MNVYMLFDSISVSVAVIIIPFSFVIFVWIEGPAIRLGDRIRKRQALRQSQAG
jgi:hypothetical protein